MNPPFFHRAGKNICFSNAPPWWLSGKDSTCHCRRRWFDPWVRKCPLEASMIIHSSILVWKTQWTEKPGGLQSMGSQRVRHNLATKQQILAFVF